MRKIKFRGKSKADGRWVYGDLRHHNGGLVTIIDPATSDGILVDPETVGQYTGMTDKNGIEIYEDDIVQYPIRNELYKATYWEQYGSFAYEQSGREINDYRFPSEVCEVLVMGNIHDNPELIDK